MLKFNEEHYLKMGEEVLARRPQFEAIGEALKDRSFDTIVISAIGGTWARYFPVCMYMRQITRIPVYLENSADLYTRPPFYLTSRTLVLTASNSGNTPEIVKAAQLCRSKGAVVVSAGEPDECVLKDESDHYVGVPMSYGEDMYLVFFMQALSILYKLGEYADYPLWAENMTKLHSELLKAKRAFEPKAAEIAKKIHKTPYLIMVSSGLLEKIAYWYCLCVLEECQWIRANSVSSPDFFHGTLELMEDGQPLLLVKGVDESRALDERVERFAAKTTDSLIVIDMADYPLSDIEKRFAPMCSVFAAASLLSDRLEAYLEENTGHSLSFRRYYRKMEY